MNLVHILSIVMIVSGLLFFMAAVVGIHRFPDFYTRLHAAGKGDTLSTILVIGGLGLYYVNEHHWSFEAILVGIKMFAIVFFIFIASPTSTHVLMRAGYESGKKTFYQNRHRRGRQFRYFQQVINTSNHDLGLQLNHSHSYSDLRDCNAYTP